MCQPYFFHFFFLIAFSYHQTIYDFRNAYVDRQCTNLRDKCWGQATRHMSCVQIGKVPSLDLRVVTDHGLKPINRLVSNQSIGYCRPPTRTETVHSMPLLSELDFRVNFCCTVHTQRSTFGKKQVPTCHHDRMHLGMHQRVSARTTRACSRRVYIPVLPT